MVHFTGSDITLFVIGFFLPPLAVLFKQGCGCEFLISLGLSLVGYVPGIVYAWWIIYTNREDPRTRRRINHGGQNSVDRRSYLAVAQQGHAGSPPSSGGGVVHAPHSQDPQVQVHSGGQSQTQTTVTKSQEQHPGLPHQNSSTRTITTTTTTRTSSNGGPPQTIQTIVTSQNGEVIDKKVVVVDKKDTPPAY